MSGGPAWLAAAVAAAPHRFPAAVAVKALGGARPPLQSDPSLALPAGEVVSIGDDGVVTLALPGLRGAGSPLPGPWLSLIDALPADSAASGILGLVEGRVLHHRVGAELARAVDDPDRFADLLAALVGQPAGLPAGLAPALADGPTPEGLAAALAWASGTRVRIEAACGGRLPLPPERRSAIGLAGRLGADLLIGTSVRGADLGFRVELGPVAMDTASRLRPGTPGFDRCVAVTTRLAPASTAWELVLLVAAPEAGSCAMGTSVLGIDGHLAGPPPRIGREVLYRS